MVGNVQAPWDVHPSPTLCGQWLKVLIAMDRRTLLGALGLALAAPLGSASAAEPPKYTRPGRVYNQNGAYEGRMDSEARRRLRCQEAPQVPGRGRREAFFCP